MVYRLVPWGLQHGVPRNDAASRIAVFYVFCFLQTWALRMGVLAAIGGVGVPGTTVCSMVERLFPEELSTYPTSVAVPPH